MWFAVILPAKQWNNRKVETNIILPARMNHHSLAGGVDCLPSSMHALKITIPKGSYSLSCSLVTQQSEGREVPGTAKLSCIEISLFHWTLMFQKKKKKERKDIPSMSIPTLSPPTHFKLKCGCHEALPWEHFLSFGYQFLTHFLPDHVAYINIYLNLPQSYLHF